MVFRRRKLKNQVQTLIDEMLHVLRHDSTKNPDAYRPRQVQAAELESRVLMSASPMAVVAEAVAADIVSSAGIDSTTASDLELLAPVTNFELESTVSGETESTQHATAKIDALPGENLPVDSDAQADAMSVLASLADTSEVVQESGPELIVIDYRVKDADTLLFELLNTDRDFRILRLDADTSGISQITEKLQQIGNVSAVHLLTHGTTGEVKLGSTVLNSETLAQHAPELLAWQHSLTSNADLLLYGCDVAETTEGQQFVDALAQMTATDVAASDDQTGSLSLGGDADLEYQAGVINRSVAFTQTAWDSWNSVLPANVAPVNTVPAGQLISPDTLLIFSTANGNAVSISDVDAAVELIEVTLSVDNGTLSLAETTGLAFTVGDGINDNVITFQGTVSDVNAALNGLRYMPSSAWTGVATLNILTNDLGNTGDGGALTDSDSVAIAVRSSYTSGTQTVAATATDELNRNDHRGVVRSISTAQNGNYVVVYRTSTNNGFFTLYNKTGSQLASGQINTAGNRVADVSVAMGDEGDFVVVWSEGTAGNENILAQRYTEAGVATGANIIVDASSGSQKVATIDRNAAGDFVIAWESGATGVQLRRYDVSGTAIDASSVTVSSSANGTNASVGIDRNRNVLVAWDGSGQHFSRFDGTTFSARDTLSTATNASGSAIGINEAGQAVIAWHEQGTDWNVRFVRINSDGTRNGAIASAPSTTSGDELNPSVAMDESGDFVISWETNANIQMRRFDASGLALANDENVATAASLENNSSIDMLDNGNVVVLWTDQSSSADVKLRRYGTAITDLQAPVIDPISNQSTSIGVPITIDVFVGDADTDIDNLTLSVSSSNTAVVPSSQIVNLGGRFYRQLQITPAAGQTGFTTVSVTVSDGTRTASTNFRLNVVPSVSPIAATGELLVNQTTSNTQTTSAATRGSQRSVAMAADGSYFVVWSSNQSSGTDGDAWGVLMRQFDRNGNPLTAEIQVNQTTASDQQWATVATDAFGNGVVAWTSTAQDDGSSQGVYARRFDASGSFPSNEFLVNSTTTGDQLNAVVDMNAFGEFIVAWSGSGTGDSDGIFYRRYAANGTAVDVSEVRGNASNLGDEISPAVAINDSGLFSIAWNVGNDLFQRNFAADGTPVTVDFQVDNGAANAYGAAIGIDNLGRTVTAYRTDGTFLGIGQGIWMRGFNANGSESNPWQLVAGGQFETAPSVSMANDGNFVVVWQSGDDGDGSSVVARSYDSNFNALTEKHLVNDFTAGNQQMPSVAMLDPNNFVVVWSGDGATDAPGVFARQYSLMPPVLDLDADDSSGATDSGFSTNYSDGSGPIAVVGSDATLADVDDATLQSLKVTITNRQNGSNEILAAVTTGTNISASYSGGVLTLSGSDTVANYQRVLRSITYHNLQNPVTGVSRTITFVANDGISPSNVATTTMTLNAVISLAPVITSNGGGASASINVAENSTAVTTVTATDVDDPPSSLTYSLSGVDAANFTINGSTGVLTFISPPNFESRADAGLDNVYDIVVLASDGTNTGSQSIAVTVTNVNEQPIANSDTYTATEEQTLTVPVGSGLLANDMEPESQAMAILDNTLPSHGTLSLNSNGSFSYTPDANYSGTDTFNYVTIDSTSGLIHYWKLDGNANDLIGVSNGTVNGATTVTGERGNALQFNGTSSYANVPDFTYSNEFTVAFSFKVADNSGTGYQYIYSHGAAHNAPNALNVYLIEDNAPAGTPNTLRTRFSDTNDNDNVDGLDIDAAGLGLLDNQWHQYVLTVKAGVGATVYVDGVQRAQIASGGDAMNPTGNLFLGARADLDPDRFYNGQLDSVMFFSRPLESSEVSTLHSGGTATGSVTINVANVNDGPTLTTNSTISANEGSTVTISRTQLLVSDIDNTASQITYTLGTAPLRGQLRLDGTAITTGGTWTQADIDNGKLTYTHSGSETTSDSFTFTVSDSSGGTIGSTTKSLSITPVNDSTPNITSNGGGATAAISVAENSTTITTVTATDADLPTQTLTYSISGGADAARFSINSATGALTFQTAPNFESPTDSGANNVYDVIVQVSDGTLTDTQAIAVTVTAVNDNTPTITSNGGGATAAISVAENSTTVTTVTATDADLPVQTLTYSISGGVDAARFSISSSSGALTFVTAPNFESPTDSGSNNVYDVIVRVSDGTFTDTQTIAVTVTNVNEPVTAQADSYTAIQNTPLTVPAGTGLLSNDSDPENNSMSVVAVGTPSHGTVSLTPSALATIANLTNNTATDTRAAWSPDRSKIAFDTGRDGNNEIYVMNADGSGLVRLTNNSGDDSQPAWSPDGTKIAFMSNRSGTYEVWVMNASNGTGLTRLTTTTSSVSGQPAWSPDGSKIAFTTNRDGNYEIYSMNANGTGLTRLTSATGDDSEPAWSPDGTKIAFASTRDGNSEIYVMSASGTGQTRLTNDAAVDRSPTWSPDGSKIAFISARSGVQQVYMMDSNGANPTAVTAQATNVSFPDWSSDGLSMLFTLNNEVQRANVVFDGSFVYTPTIGYVGADSFTYSVSDRNGNVSTATATMTVTAPPVITSNGGGATAAISVAENSTAVTTVTATDADLPAQTLTYSISGGADAARFSINSTTGVLTFQTAPNFESPTDSGANNVYDVIVQVSDGTLTDTQTLAVTVTAVNDHSPTITSNGGGATVAISVVENSTTVTTVTATDADLPGATLTYSISGGADAARFAIDSVTGALRFVAAPDFEVPTDAGGNNVYDVTVRVSDGSLTDTQAMSITVTNSTTGDVLISSQDTYITSSPKTNNYGQSTSLIVDKSGGGLGSGRALIQFDLTDIPANSTITSAILVMQATQISSTTAVNVYQVTQVWSEGSGNGTTGASNWDQRQAGVNWTTTGGDFSSTVVATLNATAIGQHTWDVTSLVTDWKAGNKSNFGLLLGSPSTGSGTVTYDSSEGIVAPKLLVTFDIANAPPVITSNGGGVSSAINVAENSTAVTTVTASDANLPGQTLTYSISGGADASKFTIDGATGELSFVASPNFESPADTGTNNTYDVVVQVSDGTATDTQAIAVTVTNINDAPIMTAGTVSLGSLTANQTSAAMSVSSFAAASISDQDAGASSGIAISASAGAGTWQYSTNGTTWSSIGTVSSTQALLLRSTDSIRFVGTGTTAGTASITYSAWDQTGTTTSQQGTKVSLSTLGTGGSTPFSSTSSTADLTLLAVNFAPVATTDTYTLNEGATLTTTAASGWFSPDWNARQPITFNNSTGAALTDHVVLVTLTPSSFNYANAQAAGQDLRFVDGDGTLLSYEIEEWNPGGTSQVWVRVPQINASSTTDFIWMYSGNTQAADAQNASSVWAGQQAVLHMSSTVTDSSPNAIAVTSTSTTAASGVTSGAQSYDGTSSTVQLAPNSNVDNLFAGGGTISAWINPTAWGEGGYGRIADKASTTFAGGTLGNGWALQVSNTGSLIFEQGFTVTTGEWVTAAGSVSLNNWQQVVVVYDSSSLSNNPTIYVNGVSVPVTRNSTPVGAALTDAGQRLTVGNHALATTRTFAGRIDEFRAIDSAQSAASILAQYKSISGTLVAIGASESGPGGVLNNDTDPENSPLTATLVSGPANAASFTLNANGSFQYTHNGSETTADSFTYSVSDGNSTSTATVNLTIRAVNDNNPVITSNGGGATASINVAENSTTVTTVTATDADLPTSTLTYSISGGADAALFVINSSTGALRFVAAPDRENLTDSDTNNIYNVTVQVSDGTLTDTQLIAVTVTSVNDNTPMITSNGGGATAAVTVAENTTAVTTVTATDADLPSPGLTYSISGGLDAARFTINSATGALAFATAPNFESPTDNGTNNVYNVTVQVSDGTFTDTQSIAVTITSVNDLNPVITSNGGGATAFIDVAENSTAVTTITATDADLPSQTLTYSIIGGSDATKFTINSSTGFLSFVTAPDCEAPTDSGTDNVYNVTVQVTDGTLTDTQAIAVTVTQENDNPPVITFGGGGPNATVSIAENESTVATITAVDPDQSTGTRTWSISGGTDAARFSINSATGVLRFVDAPNFELPADSGANNVYDVVVRVSDGTLEDTQAIAVTVTPTNDNTPVITSNGGGGTATVSIGENSTAVTTVSATDADLPSASLTYSINGGADAARFVINSSTGALSFVNAPNFEAPTDSNTNNVYGVVVLVSDGTRTDSQTFFVSVTNVNDAPAITSNGGAATGNVSVVENSTIVTTVASTDVDGATPTYSIAGGADQSFFAVNSATGVLSFVSGQNFEIPNDADGDNIFVVAVQVNDGNGGTDLQTLNIRLTNANETPTASPITPVSILEDAPAGTVNVAAAFADPDGDTLTFRISQVTSSIPLFRTLTIDSSTGVISYALKANAFGTATISIEAKDSGGQLVVQQLSFTVQPVNDAPVTTGYSNSTTPGQAISVSGPGVLAVASDVDGDSLQAILIQAPAHGTVTLQANGSFVYTPDDDFVGVDTFRFAATDGLLTSAGQLATITVAHPVIPIQNGSGSTGSSTGSTGSGSSTTSSGNSGSGSSSASTGGTSGSNNSSTSTSTGNSNSTTSGNTGSGGDTNASSSTAQPGGLSGGVSEGKHNDDEEVGLIGVIGAAAVDPAESKTRIASTTSVEGPSNSSDASDRVSTHRSFNGPIGFSERGITFDSSQQAAARVLHLQREVLYQSLVQQNLQNVEGFEDTISRNLSISDQVVGSVGVVTTSFSVGYLIWAVRFGTLLSGLLTQIPTWSMLDPLLVIDGEQKDEDKESLQTLMDRQQDQIKASTPRSPDTELPITKTHAT